MANEYLKRIPTSSGNTRVFTISCWLKHQYIGSGHLDILHAYNGSASNRFQFMLQGSGNNLEFWSGGGTGRFTKSVSDGGTGEASFRDQSGWMHVVGVMNTPAGEEGQRCKIYVNGVERSLVDAPGSGSTGITQNANPEQVNERIIHHIMGVANDGSTDAGQGGCRGQLSDYFFVDGQALTPDVFGFYKDGDGYMSSGTTQATDFRPGQWSPRLPKSIKYTINRSGGFGVNGFYLPMNDPSNPGADFHCTPNSIIKLKGEDLPQPQNGAPTTSDAYVSELRSDPFAANIVLAVPGASTVIGPDIVNNGYEWTGASGTTPPTGWDDEELDGVETYSVNSSGQLVYDRNGESEDPGRFSQDLTTVNGKVYHLMVDLVATTGGGLVFEVGGTLNVFASTTVTGIKRYTFTATSTTTKITIRSSSVNGTLTIDNVKVRQVDDAPRDYSADIKGSGTNKTLTANGNAGVGYELGGYYGSAMTFDGSGDYLSDTTTTDFLMNNEDFTAEAWVYYDGVSVPGQIVGIWGNNGNNRSWMLYHNSTPKIKFAVNTGNGGGGGTLAVGDYTPVVGQWYHLAGEKEGTTIRLYVNGVCVGTSNSALTSLYNSNAPLTIGAYGVGGSPAYFEGRIQDVRLYKGVAKYKGGFDVPKPYTPVGIESWRTTADTCKNNFATFNPLKRTSNQTLSDGNLTCTQAGQVWGACASTIAMDESSGKYYVEYRVESNLYSYIGIANANSLVFDLATVPSGYTFMGATSNDWGYLSSNGGIQHNNSNLVSGGAILNAGDILGITFDTSNKEAKWYANGVLQYTTTLTGNYPFFFASGSYQSSNIVNFGQNPSFSGTTTAGTNADDSGKGLFKYAPPTGFLALCEDNLPAPAIADPGEHFKCVLYGGDSNSGHSITGVGFKPDFVWIKNRDTSQSHYLFDTIRGVDQVLWTDLPNEENDYTASGGRMPSFDSNGFTVNYSSSTGTNASGDNYVAWCWKAGGAAVSNTDGTITSQVSANQDAGFSIVSYTGTGANATVGHGLGKAPSFVIVKNRDSALNWAIWHSAIAGNQYFRFTTNDVTDLGTVWNSSIPTSSIINLGSSIVTNESTSRFIAYVWTEIENYSKFGSYIGNDGPDGPFVYCGFKPAFVLTKLSSDINGHWILWDSSRTPTNLATTALSPNNSWTDTNGFDIDLLSNGFKQRDTETSLNVSGETYIFAAFAESPFQTANAK